MISHDKPRIEFNPILSLPRIVLTAALFAIKNLKINQTSNPNNTN